MCFGELFLDNNSESKMEDLAERMRVMSCNTGHSPLETVQFPIQPSMAREPRLSAAAAIREQWPNRRSVDKTATTQGGGGNFLHQYGAKHSTKHGNNMKCALEHYQTGNYLGAMKICRTLLATNNADYEAQLLLGRSLASYKMIKCAEEAFRAAIKIDDRDYRGWKGLGDVLEETSARTLELLDVYLKIITYARPKLKTEWNQTCEKVVMLHTKLGGKDTMNSKLRNLRDFLGYPTFDGIMSKWLDLIYSFPTKIASKADEVIMKAACRLVKESPYSDQQDQMKCDILLSMICKEHWTEVETKCLRMHKTFPNDKFPLKILAKQYIKTDMGCINDKMLQIYEDLFKTDHHSALAAIGLGHGLLAQRQYESAITSLKKGLATDAQNVYGWLYLAQAQLAINDTGEAQRSAHKGLEALNDKSKPSSSKKSVKCQLELCRAQSTATVETPVATRSAKKSTPSTQSTTRQKHQVELSHSVKLTPVAQSTARQKSQTVELNRSQRAVQSDPDMATIATLVESIPPQSLKKIPPFDCYKKLLQVCKRVQTQRQRGPDTHSLKEWKREKRAEYNLQHAMIYWDQSMTARTDPWLFLTSILQALKQDPWNADVFLYLGKYICEIVAEMRLGQEFLEMAFNLRPDSTTGAYLVDVCMMLQERERAIPILHNSLRLASNAKWACLRLGLIQMSDREYNWAENSFWSAINADSRSNRQPYECLGRNRLRMGLMYDSMTAFASGAKLQTGGFMSSMQVSDADVTALEASDLRAMYSDTFQWISNPQATGVQFAFSFLYAICPELLRPIGYNFDTVIRARKAITNIYSGGGGSGGLSHTGERTDWGEADKQCAYMLRFFVIHCQFVPWLLRITPNILARFPTGNHLRVCCVGGGPGSDIVGLITFLRSINRNTRLTCHILDKFPAWNNVWKTIQSRLPPPATNASYLHLDITSSAPLDTRLVEAIQNADIVTFVKSVSPAIAFLKNPPPMNQKYPLIPIQSQKGAIPTILRTLKSGALVVYVDNRYGDQNSLFKNMALSEGLKLVYQKVWVCNIQANMMEYDSVWNGYSCKALPECSVHGMVFYKP